MKILTAVVLVPLALFVFACCAHCSDNDKGNDFARDTLAGILQKMEMAEKEVKDLSADISQTKVFKDFDDTAVFKGIFRYKKPRLLYWEFYSPDASVVVVNEKEAMMYVPEIKQVQKIDVKNSPKGVSMIFGFDHTVEELKTDFDISVAGVEQEVEKKRYVLNLEPKTEGGKKVFLRVRLWVPEGGWIPDKIKVFELGGDETATELFNMKKNTGLSREIFYFKPPKDAEVVNMDGF